MCLIVAKPKGTPLPIKDNLDYWFEKHPDGFGMAFQHRGKVAIIKGALTPKTMHKLVSAVKDASIDPVGTDMIFHFRQATTGNVTPHNCHPFPISSRSKDHRRLTFLSNFAVAHNGIISDYESTRVWDFEKKVFSYTDNQYTDTQKFVQQVIAPIGDALFMPGVQKMIASYGHSRFAILTSTDIVYIGTFLSEDGYKFSNSSYQLTKVAPAQGSLSQKYPCEVCGELVWVRYFPMKQLALTHGIDLNLKMCRECHDILFGEAPPWANRAIEVEQSSNLGGGYDYAYD